MEPGSIVQEQFYSFVEGLVVGVVIGAGFDIYRALRLQFKCRPIKAVSFITDCLFWVGAAAVCITVIMVRRWGEVYLYSYLAIAGGFAGYIYILSRFLLPLWRAVFRHSIEILIELYCVIIKTINVILIPFLWIERGIVKGVKKYFQFYSRNSSLFRRKA